MASPSIRTPRPRHSRGIRQRLSCTCLCTRRGPARPHRLCLADSRIHRLPLGLPLPASSSSASSLMFLLGRGSTPRHPSMGTWTASPSSRTLRPRHSRGIRQRLSCTRLCTRRGPAQPHRSTKRARSKRRVAWRSFDWRRKAASRTPSSFPLVSRDSETWPNVVGQVALGCGRAALGKVLDADGIRKRSLRCVRVRHRGRVRRMVPPFHHRGAVTPWDPGPREKCLDIWRGETPALILRLGREERATTGKQRARKYPSTIGPQSMSTAPLCYGQVP